MINIFLQQGTLLINTCSRVVTQREVGGGEERWNRGRREGEKRWEGKEKEREEGGAREVGGEGKEKGNILQKIWFIFHMKYGHRKGEKVKGLLHGKLQDQGLWGFSAQNLDG